MNLNTSPPTIRFLPRSNPSKLLLREFCLKTMYWAPCPGPDPAESSEAKRTQYSTVRFVGRSDGESAIWTNPFEPSQEKAFPTNPVMFVAPPCSIPEFV